MKKQILILSLFFSVFGIAEEFKKAQTLVATVEKSLKINGKEKKEAKKTIDVSLALSEPLSEAHLILGTLSKNGINAKACDPENCYFELEEASAKRLAEVLKDLKVKDDDVVGLGKSAAAKVPSQFYMSGNDRFDTLTACKVKAEKVPDSNCYILIPKDGSLSSRSIVKNGKTLASGMSQVDVSKYKVKNPECRRELSILEPCVATIETVRLNEWDITEGIK